MKSGLMGLIRFKTYQPYFLYLPASPKALYLYQLVNLINLLTSQLYSLI